MNEFASFADDVTTFLNDEEDYQKMQAEISKYCSISNMKINNDKTKLYLLRKIENNPFFEFPVNRELLNSEVRYLADCNEKILGIEFNKIDWKAITERVINGIRYPLIADLPISTRCLAISIYQLSIVYFRDPFEAIPTRYFNKIINEINSKFRNVAYEKLIVPKFYGGFGLMNLNKQLLGKRAKFIYYLFTEKNLWASNNLRERLQLYCIYLTYALSINVRTKEAMDLTINNDAWELDFLLYCDASTSTTRYRGFPWYQLLDNTFLNYINQQQDLNPRKTILPLREQAPTTIELLKRMESNTAYGINLKLNKFFTKNELKWLEAWFQVVNTNDDSANIRFIEATPSIIYNELIIKLELAQEAMEEKLSDVCDEKLSLESFKHYNKKYHVKINSPITRDSISYVTSQVEPARWGAFWKKLYHLQTQKPGLLEWLQRFNLGQIDHKFNFSTDISTEFPYKHLLNCCLCGSAPESLKHVFEECPISLKIWQMVKHGTNTAYPITLKHMLVPVQETVHELHNFSIYINIVWKIRNSRRYSRSIEPQFDETHQSQMFSNAQSYLNKSRSLQYYI